MTFQTDLPPYTFEAGGAPLLLSMPHSGTHIPPQVARRMTAEAQRVPDTDWHLDTLYGFAREFGVSVLRATHSRYVIDVNRPPDAPDRRQGERVTGVCPVDTFDVTPIYLSGQAPSDDEVAARRDAIWHPYHSRLAVEIERLHAIHGVVILWDAHSLRSVLPHYFEGKLTDLNLGTNKGSSCAPELAHRLMQIASAADGHTASLNGRFTGGYITRHHGQPDRGVHAFQCEITQCSYMQEAHPFDYLPDRAARVQPHLRRMMEAALAWATSRR